MSAWAERYRVARRRAEQAAHALRKHNAAATRAANQLRCPWGPERGGWRCTGDAATSATHEHRYKVEELPPGWPKEQ